MKRTTSWFEAATVLVVVTAATLASGCATRKYVRNKVEESATETTAKMVTGDRNLQQGIDTNAAEIEELGNKTADHTQRLAALDGKIDTAMNAADQKAAQAQSSASQAATHANQLDQQFQNRNQYTTLTEQNVLFDFGSAQILAKQLSTLDQIAQQMKSNADAILVLEGHTDSVGDDAYNIRLSEQRVDMVVRYLVADKDVPTHQIHTASLGESKPVAANDTAEGRAQNRSVIVKLLTPNVNSKQMASDASR